MKYGQTFQSLLNENPAFAKWDSSVVQYKAVRRLTASEQICIKRMLTLYLQLKKIINRVSAELQSVGLEADVLKQLLEQEQSTCTQDHATCSKPSRVRAEYEVNGLSICFDVVHENVADLVATGTLDAPSPCVKLVFSADEDRIKHASEEELLQELHLLMQEQDRPRASSSWQEPLDQPRQNCSGSEDEEDEDLLDQYGNSIQDIVLDGAVPSILDVTTPLLTRLYGHQLLPTSALSPPGTPMMKDLAPCTSSEIAAESELSYFTLPPASLSLPAESQSERDEMLKSSQSVRVVTVSLPNDTKFFVTLAETIASLQQLEIAQRGCFKNQVLTLADSVRKVAAPKSRTDLYNWRDIFGLWIEAAVFEGLTEQDRGQRSTEDAKQRLIWFTDQVGRRKLASSMRFKESRTALETFISLNQSLLQLQEFVEANQLAVRKILKKHDKRTALSGKDAFADLFPAGDSTSSSFTPLTSTIHLPKVISGTFTDVLLPIVPQIDDVNCMICSEVVYRPIRLRNCGHKLCLRSVCQHLILSSSSTHAHFLRRCLTELQRMTMNLCPACRHPGVMEASISMSEPQFH